MQYVPRYHLAALPFLPRRTRIRTLPLLHPASAVHCIRLALQAKARQGNERQPAVQPRVYSCTEASEATVVCLRVREPGGEAEGERELCDGGT